MCLCVSFEWTWNIWRIQFQALNELKTSEGYSFKPTPFFYLVKRDGKLKTFWSFSLKKITLDRQSNFQYFVGKPHLVLRVERYVIHVFWEGTKFNKIFKFYLIVLRSVKKVRRFQNSIVSFSEYMNFTTCVKLFVWTIIRTKNKSAQQV